MESLDQIKLRIEAAVSGVRIEIVPNDCHSGQHSLAIDHEHALRVASFLKDDPQLRFDYASNVTGIDWPESITKEKKRTRQIIEGAEREIEEIVEIRRPGYLEAVYHLYSMELKHGPVILRMRSGDRGENACLPSLTPVWRGAEFQEREIFDLYGIRLDSHPDLRRILMWDEFKDHPMRKDYVDPDDYEYEPTAHGEVLERSRQRGQVP